MVMIFIIIEKNQVKLKLANYTWNETFDLPDGSYNISEIQKLY